MAVAGEIPSNLPQKPTNVPSSDGGGLSVGATVGIGIGIAVLVILGAVGAWICVRRRRRTWAQKRKKQGDPEITGETPNEEIIKRVLDSDNSNDLDKEMKIDGAVEIGDGGRDNADSGHTDSAQRRSKPRTEKRVHEMPSAADLVEIGEGNQFVAELEGSIVTGMAASPQKNGACPTDPGNAQKEHDLVQ
jgi:hypothetical protein